MGYNKQVLSKFGVFPISFTVYGKHNEDVCDLMDFHMGIELESKMKASKVEYKNHTFDWESLSKLECVYMKHYNASMWLLLPSDQ